MNPTTPQTPEQGKELSELEILKAEYVKQWNNHNVLLEWGKPQLEALYYAKLGKQQIELLLLKKEVYQLKRKVELMQACINRNEPINTSYIDLIVEMEVLEQEEKIELEIIKYERANHLLANLAGPERSAELRKTFRQIAKLLHPDINPHLPAEARQLWNAAMEAYDTGDLESLKAFSLLAADYHHVSTPHDEQFLSTQIGLLKEGIKRFVDEIEKSKNTFPFTHEKLLNDEEWIAEQLQLIAQESEQALAQKQEYEKIISIILDTCESE